MADEARGQSHGVSVAAGAMLRAPGGPGAGDGARGGDGRPTPARLTLTPDSRDRALSASRFISSHV